MATLKHLGFDLLLKHKTGNVVIGRISIEKLAALAELQAIRNVTPVLTST